MVHDSYFAKPLLNKFDYRILAEGRYSQYYGTKHILLGLIMPVIGMCMILWPVTEVYPEETISKLVVTLFIIILIVDAYLIMRFRHKEINKLLKLWRNV